MEQIKERQKSIKDSIGSVAAKAISGVKTLRYFVEGSIHDAKITHAEKTAKRLLRKGGAGALETAVAQERLGLNNPLSNPHIYNAYVDKYLSRVDAQGNPKPVDIKELKKVGITDAQIMFDDRIMSRVMDSFAPDKDGNINYDPKSLDFVLGSMYTPGRRDELLKIAHESGVDWQKVGSRESLNALSLCDSGNDNDENKALESVYRIRELGRFNLGYESSLDSAYINALLDSSDDKQRIMSQQGMVGHTVVDAMYSARDDAIDTWRRGAIENPDYASIPECNICSDLAPSLSNERARLERDVKQKTGVDMMLVLAKYDVMSSLESQGMHPGNKEMRRILRNQASTVINEIAPGVLSTKYLSVDESRLGVISSGLLDYRGDLSRFRVEQMVQNLNMLDNDKCLTASISMKLDARIYHKLMSMDSTSLRGRLESMKPLLLAAQGWSDNDTNRQRMNLHPMSYELIHYIFENIDKISDDNIKNATKVLRGVNGEEKSGSKIYPRNAYQASCLLQAEDDKIGATAERLIRAHEIDDLREQVQKSTNTQLDSSSFWDCAFSNSPEETVQNKTLGFNLASDLAELYPDDKYLDSLMSRYDELLKRNPTLELGRQDYIDSTFLTEDVTSTLGDELIDQVLYYNSGACSAIGKMNKEQLVKFKEHVDGLGKLGLYGKDPARLTALVALSERSAGGVLDSVLEHSNDLNEEKLDGLRLLLETANYGGIKKVDDLKKYGLKLQDKLSADIASDDYHKVFNAIDLIIDPTIANNTSSTELMARSKIGAMLRDYEEVRRRYPNAITDEDISAIKFQDKLEAVWSDAAAMRRLFADSGISSDRIAGSKSRAIAKYLECISDNFQKEIFDPSRDSYTLGRETVEYDGATLNVMVANG